MNNEIEPDDDSALFYLRQARATGENESTVRILATDLGSRLVERTRGFIAAGNPGAANADLSAAMSADVEFGLTLPEVAEVRRQLEELAAASKKAADDLSAAVAAAAKLREAGKLIEPTGDNAFESRGKCRHVHGMLILALIRFL